MSGSLQKIDSVTISSAVSSVEVGVDDWDTSFDVYKVIWNNLQTDSSTVQDVRLRVLAGGSADTSSNYDLAKKNFRADTTYTNESGTNADSVSIGNQLSTADNHALSNGTLYLFSFNNSSEYSFISIDGTDYRYSGQIFGRRGGAVHTVAQACNGIQIYLNSGNLVSGTLSLYGIKK